MVPASSPDPPEPRQVATNRPAEREITQQPRLGHGSWEMREIQEASGVRGGGGLGFRTHWSSPARLEAGFLQDVFIFWMGELAMSWGCTFGAFSVLAAAIQGQQGQSHHVLG